MRCQTSKATGRRLAGGLLLGDEDMMKGEGASRVGVRGCSGPWGDLRARAGRQAGRLAKAVGGGAIVRIPSEISSELPWSHPALLGLSAPRRDSPPRL
jgi:hypothetical protein